MLKLKVPFSRTVTGLIQSSLQKRNLSISLAAQDYTFSPYRFNMLIGETADWQRNYLPVDLRGKTVLDIGAGEGETARFFLEHGASRVVAVEPDKECFRYLATNAKKHRRITAVNALFSVGMVWQYSPDFLKVDIEGYEEILLKVRLPCPAVVEVHGLQLRDKFESAGWKIVYSSEELKRGFGCVCYAYWGC